MKNLWITLLILCVSFSVSIAQEKEKDKNVDVKIEIDDEHVKIEKKEKLQLKLKDGAEPDIYIDGKKYGFEIFELLDPDKIETIDVLKGERAIEEYDAPNGVVIVTSKKEKTSTSFSGKTTVKIRPSDDLNPKIIVDGVEVDRATLKKMNPKHIETIEVIKGEKAIEQYDAANGAVIVKTKKGGKK